MKAVGAERIVRMEKRRKFPWWLVVVAVAAAFIVYQAVPKPVQVKTENTRGGVLELFLSSTGVVEGEVSDISSNITAAIIGMNYREGDSVEKGKILALLEQSDIRASVSAQKAMVSQAEANRQAAVQNLRLLKAGVRSEEIDAQKAMVAQAKAQADDAERKYKRALELEGSGVISAQDLETAKAANDAAKAGLKAQRETLRGMEAGPRKEELEAARAQVKAAEAQLSSARAALEGAEAQLGFTAIKSPLTGVVVRKHMEVGETASPLSPIFTVADLKNIWVTAEVDEEDVAAVEVGQKITVTADAYPDRKAAGTVTWVSGIAEPKDVGRVRAKVVRTKIRVDVSDMPLRPGMEVNITGRLPSGKSTLLVPNDAVVRDGEKDVVYVISEGRAYPREIRIGQSNFHDTQVLSGISEGDEVAVSKIDKLSDGRKVKVVK